jgi:hypothetical protein
MTGYVSLLSGGITQEGINVIYFSTFNTDLLLVCLFPSFFTLGPVMIAPSPIDTTCCLAGVDVFYP